MLVNLVDLYEHTGKDGITKFRAVVIGDVLDFGVQKKTSFELDLDSAQYNSLKPFLGKDIDVEVTLPRPQFPLKAVKLSAPSK